MVSTLEQNTARYLMWCNLLGLKYVTATKNNKKKLKNWYAACRNMKPFQITIEVLKMSGFTTTANEHMIKANISAAEIWNIPCEISIADCSESKWPATALSETETLYQKLNKEKEKKGNTMYEDFENPERGYLDRRLSALYSKKDSELTKHYNLYPTPPESIEEAVERFTSGAFTMKPKEDRAYYSWTGQFTWDDPKNPPNRAGYNAATDKLNKAYNDTRDTIKVLDAEKGLEALKAFEATDTTTFH